MGVHVRLRRGFAVVALAAVTVVVLAALRPAGHTPVHHASTSTSVARVASDDGVVAPAPAVLRAHSISDRAPNRLDPGVAVGASAVAALLLLAWLLVALPWSGSGLGARGRLPSRRAPPLALS